MTEVASLSGVCLGLVGPLPPARGGITLYVQRLAERLCAAGARVVVLATSEGREVGPGVIVRPVRSGRLLAMDVARVIAQEGIDLVHFHTFGGYWKEMLPFALLRRMSGVPVVVSQHSIREDVLALPRRDQQLTAMCVRELSMVLASGPTVREKLLAVGAPAERVVLLTPFIAPPAPQLELIDWPKQFAELRRIAQPLVVSGTGRLVAVGGRDLYGLDVFVHAAKKVLDQLPNAGFAYVMAHAGDAALLQVGLDYVRDCGLQDRVLVLVSDLPAHAVWAAGDIAVRPTLDDGDAVSIREAMHLGVPCIASDAVGRPPGCATYRTADADDLARAIVAMAGDLPAARALVAAHRPSEAVTEVIAIYRQILKQQSRIAKLAVTALRRVPLGQGSKAHHPPAN